MKEAFLSSSAHNCHCCFPLFSLAVAFGASTGTRISFLRWENLNIAYDYLTSATLKLYPESISGNPLEININACASTFDEASLDYYNRPLDCTTSVLATYPVDASSLPTDTNGFHEFDLLGYLTSARPQDLTISISTTSEGIVKYSSEVEPPAQWPRLVTETEDLSPSTTTDATTTTTTIEHLSSTPSASPVTRPQILSDFLE